MKYFFSKSGLYLFLFRRKRGIYGRVLMEAVMAFALIIQSASCKKDKLLTSPTATLNFSSDTILFDTVFTTAGSATKQLRVINPYRQKIRISKIYLEGGNVSPYILNVDGVSGKFFRT